MEKPKNLYVQPMDMNLGGGWGMLVGGMVQGKGGERGGRKWDNCNCIINKIYLRICEGLGIVPGV